jgi:hypothetical protein
MDYLENRLNDDVMSIIYKKIHKDKFEICLNDVWKLRHILQKKELLYECFTCKKIVYVKNINDDDVVSMIMFSLPLFGKDIPLYCGPCCVKHKLVQI